MTRLLIRLLRFYQTSLSPLKPRPCCRFYPSCSQYAIDALREWGALRGSLLGFWRVLRCNPFCRGGIDYVPRRHKQNAAPVIRIRNEKKEP